MTFLGFGLGGFLNEIQDPKKKKKTVALDQFSCDVVGLDISIFRCSFHFFLTLLQSNSAVLYFHL